MIEFEKLIKVFDKLSFQPSDITYLDICKYPKSRFEEICSRILCFYLSPNNSHGLKDLVLKSLLETISPEFKIPYKKENVRVIREEMAEDKRLDILVYSSTFTLGIENKITANLYNPLDLYKTRIDQYGSDNVHYIVLSLRKIFKAHEIQKINDSQFINVTYKMLFDTIKSKIGFYRTTENSDYVIFLYDFIKTIEKMSNNNLLDIEHSDFFYTNSDKIEELIGMYDKYRQQVLDAQVERIAVLREKITLITRNSTWWIYEGWDLGIDNINPQNPRIGLESYFEETKNNPLGRFKIFLTAWSLNDWNHYDQKIKIDFPNLELNKVDNRVFLELDSLENANDDEILDSLNKHYLYLCKISN